MSNVIYKKLIDVAPNLITGARFKCEHCDNQLDDKDILLIESNEYLDHAFKHYVYVNYYGSRYLLCCPYCRMINPIGFTKM
jgi:hypothetical protein